MVDFAAAAAKADALLPVAEAGSCGRTKGDACAVLECAKRRLGREEMRRSVSMSPGPAEPSEELG